MSASNEFIEYVMELLEPVSAIEGSKFFGGYGIKSSAIQFAMIMGNSLYFHCQTTLVDSFKEMYRGVFEFEGNRSLHPQCEQYVTDNRAEPLYCNGSHISSE